MAKKLETVEAGRGLAALLVVIFHVSTFYIGTLKYWTGDPFHGLFAFGHAGVEFFFVLSGYIMLTVHRQDIGQPQKVRSFLTKRFNRIYPFFWLVMIVTTGLYFVFPSLGRASYRDPATIVQSFFLVGQDPLHAVVFTSWTLWYEVVFYAICAAVIGAPKIGIPVFGLWMVSCLILPFTGLQPPWPHYLTAFVNVLFGLGAACSALLAHYVIPWPRVILAGGAVLFLGTGLTMDYLAALPEWLSHALFGLGSALALLGAVEAERQDKLSVSRPLILLGSASFALYLTHMLVLPVVAKAFVSLHLTHLLPSWVGLPILVATAVIGGLLAHVFIEKPILRALKRPTAGKTVPQPAV